MALFSRWSISPIILCLLALAFFPPAVFAHEGGPRLIIRTAQVTAGEVLEISGANLGTDLVVTLALNLAGEPTVLGKILCDGHGDFTTRLDLPADLPPGLYTLQVIDTSVPGRETIIAASDLQIASPTLIVLKSEEAAGARSFFDLPEPDFSRPANSLLLLTLFLAFWLFVHRRQAAGPGSP